MDWQAAKWDQSMRAIYFGAVLLAAVWVSDAHANPDVWITAGATYRIEDMKVTAITFEWRFDEYYSNRTIRTYDSNENWVLEAEEVERLGGEVFVPLEKFDYYVHIWVGGEKRENHHIESFEARVDDTKLVYRFTVALTPSANLRAEEVIVSLYDKEIYVDFQLFKNSFLLVQGVMNSDCKFRIARGKDAQSGHAQPITLKCGGAT